MDDAPGSVVSDSAGTARRSAAAAISIARAVAPRVRKCAKEDRTEKRPAGEARIAALHHAVVRAGRGAGDGEAGRVGVEFLGDDLRDGRIDALPALDEGILQLHRAVGHDAQIGGDLAGMAQRGAGVPWARGARTGIARPRNSPAPAAANMPRRDRLTGRAGRHRARRAAARAPVTGSSPARAMRRGAIAL